MYTLSRLVAAAVVVVAVEKYNLKEVSIDNSILSRRWSFL